jgi:hypothetical protein
MPAQPKLQTTIPGQLKKKYSTERERDTQRGRESESSAGLLTTWLELTLV